MNIIINIEDCKTLDIDLIDVFYLECLKQNIKCNPIVSTNTLIEKKYINETLNITEEYYNKFKKEITFEDVYDLYPYKVGNRVVKSKSHVSKDFDTCKTKYLIFKKKDPDILNKMYKGLKIELILKEKTNSLQFMQDIRTWFNQHTWEKYCDLEIEPEKKEKFKTIN